MTQPHGVSADHDLLIRIDTKLDIYTAQLLKSEADQAERFEALGLRVTALELAAARQAGFLSGGKALWAIIGALPPGIVTLVLSLQR